MMRTNSSIASSRRYLTGAALLSAALVLSACVSGAPATDPADETELSGDLVMWSGFTQGPRAEYMEAMADKFEAEHPDVSITIETFSWGDLNTKWTTGLAAGQVPDISTALPNQVVEMINADGLAPVDDVIDSIGRDRFAEPSLIEGQKDGTSYSIPVYSHAQVMWYRTDLLEAAGLEVPETWDELAEAAKALTSGDTYGLSVPFGTNDLLGARALNFYLQSAGEKILDDEGRADLTSKTALEAIEYWVDMYENTSPEGSVNYNITDQATLFYQGKTAFDFNSGFHIGGVVATTPDIADDIAAAPLPRMKKGDDIYGGETSNIPMVIWKARDNQAAAKAFVESLYTDEDYITFLHSVPGGMLPALNDISENEAYLANETLTTYADSISVIEEVVPLGTAIGMEEGPTVQAGILTSQGVIERMFQNIVLNGQDVKAAAQAAEDELNQLFESSGVEFD